MTQLRICDACSRHVFASEKACPFCSAPLGEALPRTIGQRLRRGMSRAQLLAVAAAVSGQTLGACTDTAQNDGSPGGAGTTAGAISGGMDGAGEGGDGASGEGGAAGTMAGAGGAAGGGAGGASGGGAGGEGGVAGVGQPVYGAPVDPDAGVDAGDDAGEMAVPLYGGAPIPDPFPND